MTTREPRWTDEDRAEILALALYRSQLCSLHGGPIDECNSHAETGTQFQVIKRRCRAQYELLGEQEQINKNDRPDSWAWAVQAKT